MRSRPWHRLLLPSLLLTFLPLLALAEPPANEAARAGERPRIGLVLSGGGARGAAHIGVIQVLEELRVPVDIVTGTSMGSIIGGLYALGRSPQEMNEAIQRIDWVDVFRDDAGREDFSFRRKQDDFNFLTSLRFGFKDGGFFIPSGLIQGQKLDFWLRVLTLTEHGSGSFDDLSLPFKAVATDIETGSAVVLEHGDIAVAMRASMSIPGAFAPVDLDGHRLVDGGTANNLPIDIAQAMGADVIIAIDISTPLRKIEHLQSAVGISAQMIGIPIQQNQALQIERLGDQDVLLVPELGDLGTASFGELGRAIELGAENARAHADELRRFSVSEEEYDAWRASHRKSQPPLPVVSSLAVEQDTVLQDGVLLSQVRTRPGEQLDLDKLMRDLGRIHGLDAFDLVSFDLEGASGSDLVIHATKRARGINYVRVGLNLSSDFTSNSTFSIATNLVSYPLDRYGREWRSTLQIGQNTVVGSEVYQPLGSGQRFYLMPSFEYERSQFRTYEATEPPARRDETARYDTNLLALGLEAGLNISNVARVQGGIGWMTGDTELDVGDRSDQGVTLPADADFNGGVALLEVNYDTLDNTHFPNDGSIGILSGLFLEKSLGWDDTNRRIDLSWKSFRTWRRNTIGLGINYSTVTDGTAGDDVDSLFAPRLGGFGNLAGFPRDSIVGKDSFLASLNLYRRIASPVVFAWQFPAYIGTIFEFGGVKRLVDNGVTVEEEWGPQLWSMTFFTGVETPLGPFYLAYAYGEGGSSQGYLFLGQQF